MNKNQKQRLFLFICWMVFASIVLFLASYFIDVPFGQKIVGEFRSQPFLGKIEYDKCDTKQIRTLSGELLTEYCGLKISEVINEDTKPLLELLKIKDSYFQRKLCVKSKQYEVSGNSSIQFRKLVQTNVVSFMVEWEDENNKSHFDVRGLGTLSDENRCLILGSGSLLAEDIPFEPRYDINVSGFPVLEGSITSSLVYGWKIILPLYLAIFILVGSIYKMTIEVHGLFARQIKQKLK